MRGKIVRRVGGMFAQRITRIVYFRREVFVALGVRRWRERGGRAEWKRGRRGALQAGMERSWQGEEQFLIVDLIINTRSWMN